MLRSQLRPERRSDEGAQARIALAATALGGFDEAENAWRTRGTQLRDRGAKVAGKHARRARLIGVRLAQQRLRQTRLLLAECTRLAPTAAVAVFCSALWSGFSPPLTGRGAEALEGDALRYRYVTSWANAEPPVDGPLDNAGNQSFYLGWIASFSPEEFVVSRGATLETAKWALIRVLRPELNDPPPACPPGWPDRYCGSVCSWFYSEDEEGNWQKELPPAGFPTVLTFNSPEYDDPPDGEQVLILRLNGCHPETE